jgi:hypothetical protein
VVAVAPFYGNDALLPSFLEHHRRLGIDLFVFLDVSARGELSVRLAGEGDCEIWRPRANPDPKRAIYWLNYLRWRYATGRWCLSLDPTEMFVFYNSESRHIRDLLEFLDAERCDHVYAIVVHMYGHGRAVESRLEPGQHPLSQLPFFDAYGYTTFRRRRYRDIVTRGGFLRRTSFRETPNRSPALNRIPLVKWRWYYSYIVGTRLIVPRRLNTPHSPWHSSPTACLLQFSLLDSTATLARAAAAETGCVIADGGDGGHPGTGTTGRAQVKEDLSVRFTHTSDLVECGLLNPGQWF